MNGDLGTLFNVCHGITMHGLHSAPPYLEILLRLIHPLARPDNIRRKGARRQLPMLRPAATVAPGPIRTPARSPYTAASAAACHEGDPTTRTGRRLHLLQRFALTEEKHSRRRTARAEKLEQPR